MSIPFGKGDTVKDLTPEQQKCLLNYVFLVLDCSDYPFWSLFFCGGILVFKYGGSMKQEKKQGSRYKHSLFFDSRI